MSHSDCIDRDCRSSLSCHAGAEPLAKTNKLALTADALNAAIKEDEGSDTEPETGDEEEAPQDQVQPPADPVVS